jgi:hypothetical protein
MAGMPCKKLVIDCGRDDGRQIYDPKYLQSIKPYEPEPADVLLVLAVRARIPVSPAARGRGHISPGDDMPSLPCLMTAVVDVAAPL